MYIYSTYSQTCLASTLKGAPNLCFLSEVLTISTGWHSVHELGTEWGVLNNQEYVLTQVLTKQVALYVLIEVSLGLNLLGEKVEKNWQLRDSNPGCLTVAAITTEPQSHHSN